jgi:regulator of protease activity HflC (stomatin/prohibitin superfamily)
MKALERLEGGGNRRMVILSGAALAIALLFLVAGLVQWGVNRIYVEPGQSLVLTYKGPLIFGSAESARPGYLAEEDEKGIRGELRGPGRHFYCPIWWKHEIVDDIVIEPGEVGIATSKFGEEQPRGEFLVDGDLGSTEFKGILRKVFPPGRYRVNPYAYEFQIVKTEVHVDGAQNKHSGWVSIPTGYVGVVTNLSDNELTGGVKGIQEKVLPPGVYPINGKEQQVDILEIGFREATVAVTKKLDRDGILAVDEAGEPMIADEAGGIEFPSSDGFTILMDYTAIWGIMPDQAADAIRKFGNVDAVEEKVVLPQILSICRNSGSQYSAVELLVGEDRQKFQQQTSDLFSKVLTDKKITLQYGLVRHIYIPKEVRQPIQTAFIADELKLTREQEQLTAFEEGSLREAEKKVDLEAERVTADTEKQVAERIADGHKKVGETRAGTIKLIAEIDKVTAALEAQATIVRGEADANARRMLEEAKAGRFILAVEAFGTPQAYNDWIFASSLPDDIKLFLLYAGEGTLWTDLDDLGLRANFPLKKPEVEKK